MTKCPTCHLPLPGQGLKISEWLCTCETPIGIPGMPLGKKPIDVSGEGSKRHRELIPLLPFTPWESL